MITSINKVSYPNTLIVILAQGDGDLALAKQLLQHCLSCRPYDTITADSHEAAAELLRQVDWS